MRCIYLAYSSLSSAAVLADFGGHISLHRSRSLTFSINSLGDFLLLAYSEVSRNTWKREITMLRDKWYTKREVENNSKNTDKWRAFNSGLCSQGSKRWWRWFRTLKFVPLETETKQYWCNYFISIFFSLYKIM